MNWFLPLVIFGYPLSVSLALFFDVQSGAVALAYRTLVLVYALLLIGRSFFVGHGLARTYAWFGIVFFWVLYLLRLTNDALLAPDSFDRPASEYAFLAVGAALVPSLACLTSFSETQAAKAPRNSILIGLGAVLLLMYTLRAFHLDTLTTAERTRFGVLNLNPIYVGHLGASLALSALVLLKERVRDTRFARSSVLLLVAGSGLLLLGISASRGPLIALLVCLLVLATTSPGLTPLRRMRRAALVGAFAGLALLLLSLAEERFGYVAASRVAALLSGADDPTSQFRLNAYSGAWTQFLESPWFGSSLEEKSTGQYPHNVVLESFMATGIFGGAVFVILLVGATFRALCLLRREHSGPYAPWVAILFVQYLIGANLSGAIWSNSAMWCLLAAVYACGQPSASGLLLRRSYSTAASP